MITALYKYSYLLTYTEKLVVYLFHSMNECHALVGPDFSFGHVLPVCGGLASDSCVAHINELHNAYAVVRSLRLILKL